MADLREPKIMCVTGQKGVGKSYTTLKMIKEYIKDNSATGKKGRKVLIYDVNMEYTQFKAIGIKDVGRFAMQQKVEIRRVLPITEKGSIMGLTEMQETLYDLLFQYHSGMLLLEDINRYMLGAKSEEVISTIVTNRHKDLDIICHYQSLAPLDPRMWQNTSVVRFHKQKDEIKRYKNRVPNYEMFAVAEGLVNFKNFTGDKRFYVFVDVDYGSIMGNFSYGEFKEGCRWYLKNHPQELSVYLRRHNKNYVAAEEDFIQEMKSKYFTSKNGEKTSKPQKQKK
jgi:hypothetical protein